MVFNSVKNQNGLEIISGCMFSGKTEELIARIKIAQNMGLSTALFKPQIDQRYHTDYIVSHSGLHIESHVISKPEEILNHINDINVIGVDEAQFFDTGIIEVCLQLVSKNIRVIIAGLEKDFMDNPFGAMPRLIELSGNVTRLNAICHQCGDKAFYTFRKNPSKKIIEIGENDMYEARCKECFDIGMAV